MIAALEGGEWSAARPGRTLPQGKNRYPFYRRLSGPQGRSGRAENLVPIAIGSRAVQHIVIRCIELTTRPTTEINTRNIFCAVKLAPCAYCLEIWGPHHPGTLWACNRYAQGKLNLRIKFCKNTNKCT